MDPTTDGARAIRDFYDHLAGDYDSMTGLEKRFASERPFFKLLVDTYTLRTAVDAGAGTGFHSLLLSELGVKVTAADLSSEMLSALGRNARARGMSIETVESSFDDLPRRLGRTFDAVFCMGNSLPHILTAEELSVSLKAFRALLEPRGMLFVQLLNYARILAERDRIQSAKEEGGKIFVRFYDFAEEIIHFNLLTLTRTPSGLQTHCESVPLRPWKGEDLRSLLEALGFSSVRFFGGIAMGPYDPAGSKDLVILAQH